jgi:gas vesicle protein
MRRFSRFFIGAVCGALVGSVAAILLAPESGVRLREQILERTKAFRDEIQSAYTARLTQLETELEKLRAPTKSN